MERAAHAIPHAPQWFAEVWVLVSQPFDGSMSQSAKGAVHAPTEQRPFMHAGIALATMHRASHAPQWAVFDCTSTQPPAQHVCPEGHARVALHPATQRLPTQRLPGAQWSSVTHSTQRRAMGSQRPELTPPSPAAMHAASSRQPSAQRLVAATQYCPIGQRSLVAVQGTQRPVAVSHAGPSDEEAQSLSAVQRAGPVSAGTSVVASGDASLTTSSAGTSAGATSMGETSAGALSAGGGAASGCVPDELPEHAASATSAAKVRRER